MKNSTENKTKKQLTQKQIMRRLEQLHGRIAKENEKSRQQMRKVVSASDKKLNALDADVRNMQEQLAALSPYKVGDRYKVNINKDLSTNSLTNKELLGRVTDVRVFSEVTGDGEVRVTTKVGFVRLTKRGKDWKGFDEGHPFWFDAYPEHCSVFEKIN
jgi:hypothetical protein